MPPAELEELENHPLFQAVFSETSSKISGITEDEGNRHFITSLLTGGYISANALINLCDGVKESWKDGDEAKALALIRLTTLLMLSQTFRWLESQDDAKDEAPTINLTAVSNILSLFGDNSEEAIRDFFIMDTQFKHETDNESTFTHFKVYLLAKAIEACGHKCMDWEKVSFPIKSLEPITSSGAFLDSQMLGDLDNIRALWACHSIGTQAMLKYHEEQNKS